MFSDISGENHVQRNDQMMYEDYIESKEKNVKHINGINQLSLFYDFPHFKTCVQLPKGSSHNYLEGCVKLYIKVILEHLVRKQWFDWKALKRVMKYFPYRGKDANSRF